MKKVILALLLNFIFITLLSAQLPEYPDAGQWPYGPSLALEIYEGVSETLILSGEGTVLNIASMDTNGVIQKLASFRTVYLVMNISVSPDGNTVAINDNANWISIIDISNRASPILLGRYDFDNSGLPVHLEGGKPEGMDFLDNNTLISAVTPKGIWALDISDPGNISLLGDYYDMGINKVADVEILDDYAFVADDYDGLSVFDISDLSAISLVLRDTNLDRANDIQIKNNMAYVSRFTNGVSVVSISTSPSLSVTTLGTVSNAIFPTGSGSAQSAYPLPDNHLAIAVNRSGNGVVVVDIDNISIPVLVGSTGTTTTRLVAKDYFIMATDDGSANDIEGLGVYDTDDNGMVGIPQEISFDRYYGRVTDANVYNFQATLMLDDGGTVLVDLTNTNRPETALWLHKDQKIMSSIALDDYMVSASEFQFLYLDDVSDVNNPVSLPTFDFGFKFPTHMIVADSSHVLLAYGDEINWLQVQPSGITIQGQWTGTGASRLAKQNDIVIATGGTQFSIIDFSNVASPTLLGQYSVSDVIQDVDIEGDYVYLAAGVGGVKIWDISNPASASEVSDINIAPIPVNGVDIENQVAYLAADKIYGLLTYDVSNPLSPQPQNALETPDTALKTAVNENMAVVADRNSGAVIFSNFGEIPIFKNGFE